MPTIGSEVLERAPKCSENSLKYQLLCTKTCWYEEHQGKGSTIIVFRLSTAHTLKRKLAETEHLKHT